MVPSLHSDRGKKKVTCIKYSSVSVNKAIEASFGTEFLNYSCSKMCKNPPVLQLRSQMHHLQAPLGFFTHSNLPFFFFFCLTLTCATGLDLIR